MTRDYGQRTCDRCGQQITAYCPSVQTFSAIGAYLDQGRDAVLAKIVEWEGVQMQVLIQYYEHRMQPSCQVKVAFCAFCAGPLRTWRARQCMHCLRDWH